MTRTENKFTVGDRVRHKTGTTGRILSIKGKFAYVWMDGTGIALEYYLINLEVIKEEGEHEPG